MSKNGQGNQGEFAFAPALSSPVSRHPIPGLWSNNLVFLGYEARIGTIDERSMRPAMALLFRVLGHYGSLLLKLLLPHAAYLLGIDSSPL